MVETHNLYERELLVGDRVRVSTHILATDNKRLHLAHEMFMIARSRRAAMQELMSLHVDLSTRRVELFRTRSASTWARRHRRTPSFPGRIGPGAGSPGPVERFRIYRWGANFIAGRLRHRRALYDPSQLCAIGYFAKISSTRLNAFSAAACGVAPSFMISAQPACQTCSFWTWA